MLFQVLKNHLLLIASYILFFLDLLLLDLIPLLFVFYAQRISFHHLLDSVFLVFLYSVEPSLYVVQSLDFPSILAHQLFALLLQLLVTVLFRHVPTYPLPEFLKHALGMGK